MSIVKLSVLLENSVHIGYPSRMWNPKMKDYILDTYKGFHILNLRKGFSLVDETYKFLFDLGYSKGSVLFVSTALHVSNIVRDYAISLNMPYIDHSWLGGLLTNYQVISKRISHLLFLEKIDFAKDKTYSRSELVRLEHEKKRLEIKIGGVKFMKKLPDAVFIIDSIRDSLALLESSKLKIPVISILDSNCDPDLINYKILGNNNSIRSINILMSIVVDALESGMKKRKLHDTAKAANKTDKVDGNI